MEYNYNNRQIAGRNMSGWNISDQQKTHLNCLVMRLNHPAAILRKVYWIYPVHMSSFHPVLLLSVVFERPIFNVCVWCVRGSWLGWKKGGVGDQGEDWRGLFLSWFCSCSLLEVFSPKCHQFGFILTVTSTVQGVSWSLFLPNDVLVNSTCSLGKDFQKNKLSRRRNTQLLSYKVPAPQTFHSLIFVVGYVSSCLSTLLPFPSRVWFICHEAQKCLLF